MEILPSEIISHILDFVDPTDVERASYVCRSFFEASLHPRLVRRLFIGRKTRCNSATVSQSAFTHDNATLRLSIQGRERGDDLSWNNANANYPNGTEVTSLVITTERWISPYLYVVILNDILSQFPAVEDLELKHIKMHVGFLVDASLSNHLQNLVMLKLALIENLPNFLSGPTMNYLPQIKSLTLESEVHFNNPREKDGFTANKCSVLNIREFRRICEEYFEILDEIDVMYSRLSEDNMHELCSWLHPNIQTIKLSRCAYIDDNAVNILANTARPRVLEIDSFLSNSKTQISGNGVAVIATRMTSVENLSFYINDNIRLDDHLFENGFLGLRSLSMTSYGEHSSHCLVKLTKRKLCVENLCKIDGTDLLVSLAKGSPDLQELSLDLICQIADRDLHIIAEKFPTLRMLTLNSCCELTDRSVVGYEANNEWDDEHRGHHTIGAHTGSESLSNTGISRSLDYDTSISVDQSERILSDRGIRYSEHIEANDGMRSQGNDRQDLSRPREGSDEIHPSVGGAIRGHDRHNSDMDARNNRSKSNGVDRSRNPGSKRRNMPALPRSGGLSNILVSRWLESKIDHEQPKPSRRSETASSMDTADGVRVDAEGSSQRFASWDGQERNPSANDDVSDRSDSAPLCNGQSYHGRVQRSGPLSDDKYPEHIEVDGASPRASPFAAEPSRIVADGGSVATRDPLFDAHRDDIYSSPYNKEREDRLSPEDGTCDEVDSPLQEQDDFLSRQSATEGNRMRSENGPDEQVSSFRQTDSIGCGVTRTESNSPGEVQRSMSTSHPSSRADERPSSSYPRVAAEPPRPCLRHLQHLESLCLIGCCEVSDGALSEAIRFPLLTYLKLTHCDNLSDRGVGAITTNNPRLVTFILEFCRGITDESVKSVVSNVHGLERTKFENCGMLTGASLKHVSTILKGDSALKELYIGGCPISRTEIEEFKKACPAVGFRDFDW